MEHGKREKELDIYVCCFNLLDIICLFFFFGPNNPYHCISLYTWYCLHTVVSATFFIFDTLDIFCYLLPRRLQYTSLPVYTDQSNVLEVKNRARTKWAFRWINERNLTANQDENSLRFLQKYRENMMHWLS